MRKNVSLLLAASLLALPLPSRSQEPSDPGAARADYEAGARHYDLAEFDEALASFKDAYRARTDPAFLFNIAQCLRKLNKLDDATTFYRTYLRRAPDASNRVEVERHLKDVESQMEAATPPVPPRAFLVQETPPAAPPQIDLSPQPTPTIEKHPLYKRWWIWSAAGAVAAGATVAIIVFTKHDPTTIPSSMLGYQKVLP